MDKDALNIDLEKELGLNELPLEEQRRIIENVGEAIAGLIISRATEALDENQKDELDKMLDDSGKIEDMEDFFRKNISNFDEIVAEEIAKFKKEGLEFYKSL